MLDKIGLVNTAPSRGLLSSAGASVVFFFIIFFFGFFFGISVVASALEPGSVSAPRSSR